MTRLSVNVNKIAWLRNAREGSIPDILECTKTIIEAGAHGITVHPRPDQRHIVPEDVYQIQELLQDYPNVEFNIEGNPSAGERDNGYPGFATLITDSMPDQCTLVPDTDEQTTSDHGWDLTDPVTFATVKAHVQRYNELDIRTSLFLDPDLTQVEQAREAGVDRIELYTGPWVVETLVHGLDSKQANAILDRYNEATARAIELGLGVNAGHDLNQRNLSKFCTVGAVDEVSIGHALISEALFDGLAITVRNYLQQLNH